ncbi:MULTISPECIES: BolA/IbaG family iron-sulfur metabolism protein [Gammaproteobacteria]|uniref:BolA family protein n=1 Tax=Gammaproteobacteria TaxID=1236 RepID=UPI001ADBC67A|nr:MULTISPECIES: BolA/IbaG family iron-sulfur metabolism protein [Gammaproteobacteria]MBO9483954.1 BolA/IbaG family iron-sulfur metabolism protein [Salinisphaera sp. G21_0]MBO9494012.1 BolA/IbaG family iron-sulfur metabolism protein [Thalassotalea sp. G20_0]
MGMKENIIDKLNESLQNDLIDVTNESHLHNTPPGSESHFKVVIVSEAFEGKMPVKRHQMIYGLLADELREQIHALALHTYTPVEWQTRNQTAPASPDCLGGSKK